MKIYTKTGDDGTTGLIGGGRVRKSDLRIDCYGTVDELNAAVGWAAVAAAGNSRFVPALLQIQHELFAIGSHLAAPDPGKSTTSLPALDPAMIARLESQIDAAETDLPPLRQFILPGGCELAARLHLCRTVCRRAERLIVKLAADQQIDSTILVYLNRLSDWLFVNARLANHLDGTGDVPWKK